MTKALQLFSDEALARSKNLSPTEIAQFIENFRNLHSPQARKKSILISMKVPADLLAVFRQQAALVGVPYQTLIKKLMEEWLNAPIKP